MSKQTAAAESLLTIGCTAVQAPVNKSIMLLV